MKPTAVALALTLFACSEPPVLETSEPAAAPQMSRRFIRPEGASSELPFTPGVLVNNTLYLAGQVDRNPATGERPEGIAEQTRQTMENVGAILKTAGLGYSNLVSCHVQLTDMDDYAAMNEVYGSFFEEGRYPARTTLEMPALVGAAALEISCIAYADESSIEVVRPDPEKIPPAMGPYSPAVMAGDTLYLSGQGGREPQTGEIPESIEAQTTQTLETIGLTLEAAGLGFGNVAFSNVYYLGQGNGAKLDAPYMKPFEAGSAPSRGAFQLSRLPGTISVEITFIAARDNYITRLFAHDADPDATSSPASVSGDTAYLSAYSAPGATVDEQMRAVLEEQKLRLERAGMGLASVVNANVYLKNVEDFAAMNAVFREYFAENPPARTTVGVNQDALVSVSLIAVR